MPESGARSVGLAVTDLQLVQVQGCFTATEIMKLIRPRTTTSTLTQLLSSVYYVRAILFFYFFIFLFVFSFVHLATYHLAKMFSVTSVFNNYKEKRAVSI